MKTIQRFLDLLQELRGAKLIFYTNLLIVGIHAKM